MTSVAIALQVNVAVAKGEWWRLVTAAFLHTGLLHVAVRMQ